MSESEEEGEHGHHHEVVEDTGPKKDPPKLITVQEAQEPLGHLD